MAEQEACAQIVADAVRGEPSTPTSPTATTVVKQSSQGESLLLPLLQGLLKRPHDDEQLNKQQEDEELRKLTSTLDGELLGEVRAALTRLQVALKSSDTEVLAPKRRALLALAARLQAGLIVPTTDELPVVPDDKLDGCENLRRTGGRFARKKNRQTRYTVGVSREELADARRLIEDSDVRESNAMSNENKDKSTRHILKKQISCGAVLEAENNEISSVKSTPVSLNSILKVPTSTSNDVISQRLVKEPHYEEPVSFHSAATIKQKQAPVKQSANVESSPLQNRNSIPIGPNTKNLNSVNSISNQVTNRIQNSILKAAQRKSMEDLKVMNGHESEESDLEEPLAVKNMYDYENLKSSNHIKNGISLSNKPVQQFDHNAVPHPSIKNNTKLYNEFAAVPKHYNILPTKQSHNDHTSGGSSDTEQQNQRSFNRFSNKRTKLKRANTIDIPKSNNTYRNESDASDDEFYRTMNGTIVKPKVPVFQPKTENDHKFLAFINKHNDNNNGVLWSPNVNTQSNWNNCFGNIKHTFEGHSNDHVRSNSASSARNFWKTADNQAVYKPPTDFNFRANKFGVKNVPNAQENKSKHGKLPWSTETKGGVVTGTLKVAPPNFSDRVAVESKKYIAKPIPVNQFSHAPLSAFKPPTSKKPISSPTNVTSPHIWSPPSLVKQTNPVYKEPPYYPQMNTHIHQFVPSRRSPPVNIPWSQRTARENRVHNLATKKFEPVSLPVASPQSAVPHFKEKIFTSLSSPESPQNLLFKKDIFKEIPVQGPLSAPQLVRKMESLKQKFEPNDDSRNNERVQKIDAQKLQIQFYEKQILEQNRKKAMANGYQQRRFSDQISPENYTYTVTDYTPPQISTFVPLQPTPDIERVKSHDAEKLPDVVLNNSKQPSNFNYREKYQNTSPLIESNYGKPQKKSYANSHYPKEPIYDPYSKLQQSQITDYNNSIEKDGSLMEYDGANPVECRAAVAKVMIGPVSQQAVIKSNIMNRNSGEQRDDAARSLKGVLSMYSSPKSDVIKQIQQQKNHIMHNHISQPTNPKAPKLNYQNVGLKLNTNTTQISRPLNAPFIKGQNVERQNVPAINYEGVISPKIYNTQKPVFNNCDFRVRNNVFVKSPPNGPAISPNSPEFNKYCTVLNPKLQLHLLNKISPTSPTVSPVRSTPSPAALSKSESWHQLTHQAISKRPSPHGSPPSKSNVARAKSMHLLSLPKQFEGSIDKSKIVEKTKIMEAYLSGSASPQSLSKSNSQQSSTETNVHQKQTSKSKYKHTSKTSSPSQAFTLGRSQTMPHIGSNDVAFLDENNVDDAFEDLLNEVLP